MTGNLPTVAFCGYGRAGKDTAGRFLGRVSPLRYTGSTSWHAKAYVAERLGVCEQEAWDSRHEHREAWKRILNELREDDPLFFVRKVLQAGEIVTGLREKYELQAGRAAGLLTHVVWIYKPDVPVDPTTAYGPDDCDLVVPNDRTVDDFHGKLLAWFRVAKIPLLS